MASKADNFGLKTSGGGIPVKGGYGVSDRFFSYILLYYYRTRH
jgi:hypothetical protein